MSNNRKEQVTKVIEFLKKEANVATDPVVEPAQKQSAEDLFKSELLKSASVQPAATDATSVAQEIIKQLEKEMENKDVEKIAGVSALGTVASAPGTDAPGADEPTLGKTQTTANEIEKGLVAKSVTDKVNALIDQLVATRGMGGSVIIDDKTNAIMPTMGKQSELEKEAAEKRAAAGQVLSNLFEKFANVEGEEATKEAILALEKYASAAEDQILELGIKEGEYDHTHIQKVAEALITRDLAIEQEAEFSKQAAYEFGSNVADAFYARLEELGTNMQKQAQANAEAKAKSLLEKKGSYTDEDIKRVADYLLAQEAEVKPVQTNPAEEVIKELETEKIQA